MGIVVAGITVLWPSDKRRPAEGRPAPTTGSSEHAPTKVAQHFLTAFANGDVPTAASLTDAETTAQAALKDVREALRPTAVSATARSVSVQDAKASASFTVKWQFGGDRAWSYDGAMELVRTDRWRVHWSPSVVHPTLTANQRLGLGVDQPRPALVDQAGTPLLTWDIGVSVLLDRGQAGNLDDVAGRLATALSRYDATVTKKSIVDGSAGLHPGTQYKVTTLSDQDYQEVKPQIYTLPGVSFPTQTSLRGTDPELRSFVMGSLHKDLATRKPGKPGWRVVAVDTTTNSQTVLHEQPGEETPGPVTTTLRPDLQKAAQNALRGQEKAAALVAVKPSTGEILAVAQNAAADKLGDVALLHRMPPGSTFKVVSASAVLQHGLAAADSPLPCPGVTHVGGQRLPNENQFDLGTVPLRTAFAASCNTTFAELAVKLPARALPAAAAQLGLLADYDVAGIRTAAGSVPEAGENNQRVEDAIGQGRVEATPFGMAVATATVASGRSVTPILLRGQETRVSGPLAPPPPGVVAALRGMMREVVTSGTARELARFTGLHGKTGTAEHGAAGQAHGWFVGFRGDLAFAVLVVDGGSSKPALQVTANFLDAVG
ncbi:penicillin-binding transpeptidase domain-containing protein [Streptoalloteichus hindustanus]|uniref:Cell division protein FtsI/penicillin-binding protein 2 n=1 Tax=Streptoalloteichus hindustanus TaxID=2017 RepID=A0A1M5ACJ5_STRHI|nr:penicillin-binding transpeptidase domain-containing protein [Streptoalloteichus hindustanus]SHF28051.1 Cell division protein FtsI/penicillin-binding protein 2 [Streptoalloteichus hindustanus]